MLTSPGVQQPAIEFKSEMFIITNIIVWRAGLTGLLSQTQ
jgi:hypothetical protein